jgi:Tfp pilus assembly protein PilZ
VRAITEEAWVAGQVVNLSVTGVLLQLERKYNVGERVEVEIDFLTQPESKTVVAGIGYVVRGNGHGAATRRAAIHFDLGCAPKAVEPKLAAP